MEKADFASKTFRKGFNCSQAVVSAYAGELGLDKSTALKLASAFGGGIGGTAGTCGALTGAVMVIGLIHGSHIKGAQGEACSMARGLMERFASIHGSTECRDLLGLDISTPDGMDKARKSGLFKEVCPGFVSSAVRLLEEALDKR